MDRKEEILTQNLTELLPNRQATTVTSILDHFMILFFHFKSYKETVYKTNLLLGLGEAK